MEILFSNWIDRFKKEIVNTQSLKIIVPFIGDNMCKLISEEFCIRNIELITRFNTSDFHNRVSSIDGISRLLSSGAKIYGVKQLHSKVYILDNNRAIVTSANFTDGGLIRNHECGVFIDTYEEVNKLILYFESLRIGKPLTKKELNVITTEILNLKPLQLPVNVYNDHGDNVNHFKSFANVKYKRTNNSAFFFVNIGDITRNNSFRRTWESNKLYNFISAGQKISINSQLKNIGVNDIVLAYTKRIKDYNCGGYIGVGVVTHPAIPINDFILNDGADLRNRDYIESILFENSSDVNNTEYILPVKWIATRNKTEGVWRKGLFFYRDVACNMSKQTEAVNFVLTEMKIEME